MPVWGHNNNKFVGCVGCNGNRTWNAWGVCKSGVRWGGVGNIQTGGVGAHTHMSPNKLNGGSLPVNRMQAMW